MVYRLIINGGFKDFKTLREALVCAERNWTKHTTVCNIRKFYPFNNIIREMCVFEGVSHDL